MSSIVGTIGGILGIFAFLWRAGEWLFNYNRNKHPWKLTFSLKSRKEIKNDQDMTKKIQLPIGETTFLMRVQTLKTTNFTIISIRPKDLKTHKNFVDAPMRIIKVEKDDPNDPEFEAVPDNVGGMSITYKTTFERWQGFRMHYRITMDISREQNAGLEFSAVVNDVRRFSQGLIEVYKT